MALRSIISVVTLGLFLVSAQDEEEGRAVLLLHKKLYPSDGFTVNQPINVTLQVFNKGQLPHCAFAIALSSPALS